MPIDFAALGVDLCSVTAHKLGGPRVPPRSSSVAVCASRPSSSGGMQERARRGGIEDVAAIVGFGAAAAELVEDERLDEEADRARALDRSDRDRRRSRSTGVERFGDPDRRLPHLVCIGIEGVEAEPVLLSLDQRGIAVHSGSSCSSEALEPSPVLIAMGVAADQSLRVSVGWSTTPADVDAFVGAFPEVVAKLRALRGVDSVRE